MKNIFATLLLSGCFLFTIGAFAQQENASLITPPGPVFKELVTTKSCAGKKYCLVVYVTPWCPACEELTPKIQNVQQKTKTDPETGLRVIVGLEKKPGDNKKTADKFTDPIIDQNSEFNKLLPGRRWPLILLTENGKIVKNDDEAREWAGTKFQDKK